MNGDVGEFAVSAPTTQMAQRAMSTAVTAAKANCKRRSATIRRPTPILIPENTSANIRSRPGTPSSIMRNVGSLSASSPLLALPPTALPPAGPLSPIPTSEAPFRPTAA